MIAASASAEVFAWPAQSFACASESAGDVVPFASASSEVAASGNRKRVDPPTDCA